MLKRVAVLLGCIGVITLVPTFGAGALNAPLEGSHVASTWDALSKTVRVYDTRAISGTVDAVTTREPSADPSCDLYVTTFTITWVAKTPHLLTSVQTEDDDFGLSWQALNTSTWSLEPGAPVQSHQAPVVRSWYVKGTHRSDPQLCPRDTRTTSRSPSTVPPPVSCDNRSCHLRPAAISRWSGSTPRRSRPSGPNG
jgi:hypothetical protein